MSEKCSISAILEKRRSRIRARQRVLAGFASDETAA